MCKWKRGKWKSFIFGIEVRGRERVMEGMRVRMPGAHNDNQLATVRLCSRAKMAEATGSLQHCIRLERLWCLVPESGPQIYELITHSDGPHFLFMAQGPTRPRPGGPRWDRVMWGRHQAEGRAKAWAMGEQEEDWGEKPGTCPPPGEALRGIREGLVWGERRSQASERRTSFKEEDGGRNWDKTTTKPTGWAVD